MKILVVDDSKAMRMIVKRNVGQAFPDTEFVEAENGAQALEVIHTQGEPDLVLCDWNMPEMNGIELLKALRAEGSQVPFGFVTSESQPQMREQAIAEGALFLLAKPFTPDSFQELLASVV
ncbi:MAG: response regulator [Acidimicrobiia bacterium]|nr:response regulator [Acidimicrobiia bacterium]